VDPGGRGGNGTKRFVPRGKLGCHMGGTLTSSRIPMDKLTDVKEQGKREGDDSYKKKRWHRANGRQKGYHAEVAGRGTT